MVIFIWFCIISINMPYLTNCCMFYYDFERLGSTYDFNHSMIWYTQVHGPILGTMSTVVPSVLYCCIAVNLYAYTRSNNQSDFDVSLCWQFFFILLCHLVATSTFQMIPNVSDHNLSLIFLIPVSAAIDLSINPLVYFIWNKTIKTAFKQMITRNNVAIVQQIQLNQLAMNARGWKWQGASRNVQLRFSTPMMDGPRNNFCSVLYQKCMYFSFLENIYARFVIYTRFVCDSVSW